MEIMRRHLYEFLEKHCLVQKGCEFTHTNIYGPTASYYIKPDKLDKFYELYKAASDTNGELCLTEKHRDIGPVVIDLDFRFQGVSDDERLDRKYNHTDVMNILTVYANGIVPYLPDDKTTFKFYVLEKPEPVVHKGLVKDGIHIMIPDIVTRPMFQLMLREKLLPDLERAMASLGLHNKITDVVDEAVIERNNWQMYGSKKPHCARYVVTAIYEYDVKSQKFTPCEVSDKISDYVETLSIRNAFDETEIKFEKPDELERYQELVKERKMRNHFKNCVLGTTKNTKMNVSEEDFGLAQSLADLLSKDRADNYNEWIRVGWCLRNIDHRLLDRWTAFSQKSAKFVEGETDKHWNYMKSDDGGLRMGTLHMWAKQDEPVRYAAIVQQDLRNLVRMAANGTEYDVAKVVEKMYGYQYIYDSTNKLWYAFYNHRWHRTDDGMALRKKLPTEVGNTFRLFTSQFQAQAALSEDNEEKDRLDKIVSNLGGIINKLKKASFQMNVITQCAMLFNVEKIDDKFDTNTQLIGFENGVYDLDALEFREGRPEDYISISTGNNYIEYDPNSPSIAQIKAFFCQILPTEVVREYVMHLFASFLHGDIREERFHVWTGVGSNGKSKCLDLFQKSFGEYCCTLPISLLTQKRSSSNSASPELSRAKSRRFACLQEPGESERLNIGLMKELTGGDKVYARGLYREGSEFKPQFKMILTCNHLPQVPSDDGGTWRRIRVVRFESRFCDHPDPSKPNEFPIDTQLSSHFDEWKEPFISLLIEYYKDLVTNCNCKVKEPEQVLECTREYQRRNDTIADFLDSAVEVHETGFLSIADAFVEFKNWLKEEGVVDRTMRKSDFQAYIDKQSAYGKAIKKKLVKGWNGFRLKSSVADFNIQDEYD
jgi:P4 family phage/plasmid primase-like protien